MTVIEPFGASSMNLAAMIDHTLLKAEAGQVAIDKVCDEAIEHGFASVCVNGRWVKHVADRLSQSDVKTCSVVGFPLGANNLHVKAMETVVACKDGADEIDFVASLSTLARAELHEIKAEFMQIVKTARDVNRQVVVKVILETAWLMQDVPADQAEHRIATACQAAIESGCDFVKTSTGMHAAGGATIEAVQLMRKYTGGLGVKASGGIRNKQDALNMVEAGATRIGCSAGVQIVRGETVQTNY